MEDHTVIAYLKPTCGWSRGVRAVLKKYGLAFDERDVINNPGSYSKMVRKSGQSLQPCVEIDGEMLADVSGKDLDQWLDARGYQPVGHEPKIPTDSACWDRVCASQAKEQWW